MATDSDVVVAGGGPAGVTCAIAARLAGRRVALLDPGDDRPWKIGESLPGAVLRPLRRLQLSEPGAAA